MAVTDYRGPSNDGAAECVARVHHRAALAGKSPIASALVAMLAGWEAYAAAYRVEFQQGACLGDPIGDDYVLGDDWRAIGGGLLGLLNGPTGGLDCGSIDDGVRRCALDNHAEIPG